MKLQPDTINRIDALFSPWARYDSPGASLAIVDHGEVIYSQGYGMANLEYDVPNSPSTIFHVASVSKQFTAMAIVLLAEEGKLALEDDIHDYLPEIPDFGHRITIRHLAHHVSGLRDQWELLRLAGWRSDDVITRDHIMKLVRRQRELNFEPGSQFLYCNTGYTLMAEIVSRVSGESFAEFTRKRIFDPLDMASTHFHDDHELIVKNRAYSYAPIPGTRGFKKQVLSFANVGATSLFTTVEDLSRWIANFGHNRVGGATAVEQLQESFTLTDGTTIDYALGLKIEEFRGRRIIDHSGSDAGFRSLLLMFPDEELGVIVLSNLGTFRPGELAQQVALVLLGEQPEPAEESAELQPGPDMPGPAELPGTYHVERAQALCIEKRDGDLVVTGPELDAVRIEPQDNGTFVVPGTPYQFKPFRSAEGLLTLNITGGRATILASKVSAPVLSPEVLADYAGHYFSRELETTYHLVTSGQRLVMQHQRRPDVTLVAVEDDLFSGLDRQFGDIEFQRDDQGSITGFRVSGGRVRGLLFEKFPGFDSVVGRTTT